MKLRSKFLLLLICVIITPIILVIALTYNSINKSITKIESDKGNANLQHSLKYIDSILETQKDSLYSWLPWGDLYTAVETRSTDWIYENVLSNAKVDTSNEILIVLDKNFNVISSSDTSPSEWRKGNLSNLSIIKNLNLNTNFTSDIVLNSNSAYFVAIGKICSHDDTKYQNPNGYLITARKVTTSIIKKGSDMMSANIAIDFNNGYVVSSVKDIDLEVHANTNIKSNKTEMIVDIESPFKNSLNKSLGTLHVETKSSSGTKALTTLTNYSIVLVILILLLSIVILIWLNLKVSRPINKIINIIKQKDLSQQVPVTGKDEISILAREFNGFTDNLMENFKEVKDSAEKVKYIGKGFLVISDISTKSMNQISSSIGSSTSFLNSNISELKNISNTVDELNQSSTDILIKLEKLKKDSQSINNSASKGMNKLEDMSKVIKETDTKFNANYKTINTLTHSIESIHNFTKLIDDISSQSNLLALNASIEASKAGESGGGFAVVSEEVRKLSLETEGVVEKMNNLIEEILKKAKDSNTSTSIVKKQLESTDLITNQTYKEISSIISKVLSITNLISDIALQYESQTQYLHDLIDKVDIINNSFEKVNGNFTEINKATHSQLLTTENLSQKAGIMSSTIDALSKIINQFKGL
ncbi:MAG: methyl-accepting chemotaxis protein [Clostridium sp.]